MTSDGPLYYNRTQLAEAAGVTYRRIGQHVLANTGNLAAAREKMPGVGVVFKASKCAKFLGLMAAGATGRRRSA